MTSTEMLNAFLLKYDINGNAAVGFTDDEIYEWLSAAQTDVAKEVFSKYGSAALSTLIYYTSVSISSSTAQCEYVVKDSPSALYDNVLFLLNATVDVTRTFAPEITTPEPVDVEIVGPELINKFRCTSFNKTVFINPKLIIGTNIKTNQDAETPLLVDSYTTIDVLNATLDIVKIIIPPAITASDYCLLDEKWHNTVVDRAIELATLATSDQRTDREVRDNNNKL